MATYVKAVKETCMPPLFVQMIKRSTKIGDEVRYQDSENYFSERAAIRDYKATVTGKSRYLCLTDLGSVSWIDIALYQWRRHIKS